MATPVLILSRSGSGKTSSLRNFAHDELALINVLGKPLPFKGKFDSTLSNITDVEKIKEAIFKTDKKSIAIDDFGYILTTMLMRNYGKGNNFDLYANIGQVAWDLTEWIRTRLPEDKIVYVMMHEDQNEFGGVKPKTVGKMTDEKICLEGIFTLVLHGVVKDGEYLFETNKINDSDVTKSPLGLFSEDTIDNDLKYVDQELRKYYGLAGSENEKKA